MTSDVLATPGATPGGHVLFVLHQSPNASHNVSRKLDHLNTSRGLFAFFLDLISLCFVTVFLFSELGLRNQVCVGFGV